MSFLARHHSTFLAGAFVFAFAAFLWAVAPPTSQPKRPDLAGHKALVGPFLKAHCLKCHGTETKEGNLSLHDLDADLFGGKHAAIWQKIAHRLQKGEMPPEEEPRPRALDTRRVLGWINGELRKAGKTPAERELIATGNHVDHAALFSDKTAATFHAPPRVWRVSPHIYDGLTIDIARKGRVRLPQPFAGTGKQFDDQAEGLTIDEPTTAQLIRNAMAIVEKQTAFTMEGGRVKAAMGSVRDFAPLFDTTRPPTAAQIEAAVRHQFKLVLKRQPGDDELKRFVAFTQKNIKDAGQVLGVRTALSAVFLLPEVVFRLELGAGRPDDRGRVRLSGREIAYAVGFALTDKRPDATLLAAAAGGKLATREGVAAQVRRLLDDSGADKPRVLRFFREYFGYHNAPGVFKNQKDFPGHVPEALVRDTDQLVLYVLAKDKDVFRELLTTDLSYVGYAPQPLKKGGKPQAKAKAKKGKAIYQSYNLSDFPERQPTRLPAAQRAGVLTQPSWLVAHSLNTENHAILRGKWVRERLLGGTVPDLPISVDAQLPEDDTRTLRERMKVTQQAYCWNCHQRMNPLGLTFEIYDHFGRWRKTELGRPVDATGKIDRTNDAKLEGDVPDALAMIRRLAGSDRARQVFIRHAFRFWMGREENLGDAPSLLAADRAYVKSGGSMKALIVALLTSDSFLYRSEAAK